jgi:nitroreductase
MEFESVLKRRKSVREFKAKKPSWEEVLDAIDLANQGPFADNNNNLIYLIVEDSVKIKEIASLCEQSWISNSKLLVLVCSDDTHLENLHGERGRIYSRQQAGAAIYSLILALTNKGIDSCWVGAYSDELIRTKLKIPQHIQIEAVVPTGFESSKCKKPEKVSLEKCLRWETWPQDRRPNLFEDNKQDYD